MIPLSKPTKILDNDSSHGVFEVEALYPGYGVTIGNSLRRVLLSSLEGAAITQVQIKGAPHEFSTLPGVLEDVIGIILNLKQIRFRLHADEPQQATLKIKGAKDVTAADFKLPSQLEIMNPDLPIATLTDKNAELEMEIQVDRGIGYVSSQEHKQARKEIGIIVLDSIFTPVQKVNYRVENMRVGDRTDFDRLTIEIDTDGTISPEKAFASAADILVKEFDTVLDGVRDALTQEDAEPEAEKPAPKKKAATKKTTTTKKKTK